MADTFDVVSIGSGPGGTGSVPRSLPNVKVERESVLNADSILERRSILI